MYYLVLYRYILFFILELTGNMLKVKEENYLEYTAYKYKL